MRVLALDPSTTCTGWALLTGPRIETDTEQCGRIKPSSGKIPSWERVAEMASDLLRLIDDLTPTHIVIEWPSVHVRKDRRGRSSVGLSVYGTAPGAAYVACMMRGGFELHAVESSTWTRTMPRKEDRAIRLSGVSAWSRDADPKLDVCDAILMGQWWIERHAHARPV